MRFCYTCEVEMLIAEHGSRMKADALYGYKYSTLPGGKLGMSSPDSRVRFYPTPLKPLLFLLPSRLSCRRSFAGPTSCASPPTPPDFSLPSASHQSSSLLLASRRPNTCTPSNPSRVRQPYKLHIYHEYPLD